MDMGSLPGNILGTELQKGLLCPPLISGTLGKANIDTGFHANQPAFRSRVRAHLGQSRPVEVLMLHPEVRTLNVSPNCEIANFTHDPLITRLVLMRITVSRRTPQTASYWIFKLCPD